MQFRKGIKPNIKWSDKESYYKTGVVERDPDEISTEQFKQMRTFEKLIASQKLKNKDDIRREKETEEMLIKQAPRMLREEIKAQLEEEKAKQASF